MPDQRRTITCVSCGRRGKNRGHRKCSACYNSDTRAASRPWTGPGPHGRGVSKGAVIIAGRIEDYAELTREQYYTLPNAAARMGISERTAWRYEARLREREQSECVAA
jgi:hypothetical protein